MNEACRPERSEGPPANLKEYLSMERQVLRCAQDDGYRDRPRAVTGQMSTSVSPFTTWKLS